MDQQNPFKWRHYEADIILLCVCWDSRYSLSYRDLEEMMRERGLHVDHTTIYRWVQRYAPELEKRSRPHLNTTNDSWRVDETYVKVKKVWMYLYRAVDSQGNTLEFRLSATRDAQAAKAFFSKTLAAPQTTTPRVINVDKNAAYPKAFKELQAEGAIADSCELRQVKYLNNIVDQDHRFIKRRVKPGLGFFSFETAWNTLHALRKFIFFANEGKIRQSQDDAQTNQAGSLNLMTNAVVTWNTVYMQQAVNQLKAEGHPINEADLKYLSPARHVHINPYGKYEFNVEEELNRKSLRPLRKG